MPTSKKNPLAAASRLAMPVMVATANVPLNLPRNAMATTSATMPHAAARAGERGRTAAAAVQAREQGLPLPLRERVRAAAAATRAHVQPRRVAHSPPRRRWRLGALAGLECWRERSGDDASDSLATTSTSSCTILDDFSCWSPAQRCSRGARASGGAASKGC